MSSITLNLSQFAFGLGATERLTLEASLVFHTAYHKADAEGQRYMRTDFVTGYVQGALGCTRLEAEAIVALKRVERSETQEKAVNAAGQKFKYHVIRATSSARTEADPLAAALRAFSKLTTAQKKKFLAAAL